MKINCPCCNSLQKFNTKNRDHDCSCHIDVYVKCSKCRYEIFCYESTKEIELIRKDIKKLSERSKKSLMLYKTIERRKISLIDEINKSNLSGQIKKPTIDQMDY